MKSLLDSSPRYRRFISDRDRALEQIHLNAQTDISRILHDALIHVDQVASQLCLKSGNVNPFYLATTFEQSILEIFSQIINPILDRMKRMRIATYTLAHLSELEAIGQATQIKTHIDPKKFRHHLFEIEDAETINQESLSKRIWLSLMRIRAQILDRFRLSLIQELPPTEIMDSLQSVYPEIVVYKKPPRVLKPLREAVKKKSKISKKEFSVDFIDEDLWNAAVQSYIDTELPASRFDKKAKKDPDTEEARYIWEMEQELTDDFVHQVRKGTHEAAKDLGIQDFVWVAVLDDRTDECCRDRNGKLTSEIQTMMDNGELDTDRCDALTPPAHFNCRCTLGPVANVNEVDGPDWKSFNEWLES